MLNAETTLYIVSSKTFSTLETLKNAQVARATTLPPVRVIQPPRLAQRIGYHVLAEDAAGAVVRRHRERLDQAAIHAQLPCTGESVDHLTSMAAGIIHSVR
uniref:hypothetical protein n=1 Tax=Pseudomonas fluorescens TaxID=294 RepID=UPI00130E6BBE